jgi:hypothetical protein
VDRETFDALTRLLAEAPSRRRALGALLGAGVAGLAGVASGARERRSNTRTRRGNRRNPARPAGVACLHPGPGSDLSGCHFQGKELSGADLSSSRMVGTGFNNATLVGADLSSSNLKDAWFRNANLCRADLSSSQLRNADFRGANLTNATLRSSSCDGAVFTGVVLCNTRMCNGAIRNDGCPDHIDPEDVCCTDADCSAGRVCCAERCCPSGQVCRQGVCAEATCQDLCSVACTYCIDRLAGGTLCSGNNFESRCGGCNRDADCRGGEVCITGGEIRESGWRFQDFCTGFAGACATLTPCMESSEERREKTHGSPTV